MPRAGRSTGNCWPRSWPATCPSATWPMCWDAARRLCGIGLPLRPVVRADQATRRGRRRRPRGAPGARAVVRSSRPDAARPTGGRLPLRPVRGPARRRMAAEGQADLGRRGWRSLRPLRVCGLPCRPAVPSRRPEPEVVLAEPSGRHTVARQGPGGSREVRTAVRELSRQGRSWARSTSPKIGRSSRLSCLAQEARSGVAQWQSIRLLIEGLWVRVPPPELDRGAATAGDASMRPVASVSPRAARPSPGASSGR
jgi:hypothetical protein